MKLYIKDTKKDEWFYNKSWTSKPGKTFRILKRTTYMPSPKSSFMISLMLSPKCITASFNLEKKYIRIQNLRNYAIIIRDYKGVEYKVRKYFCKYSNQSQWCNIKVGFAFAAKDLGLNSVILRAFHLYSLRPTLSVQTTPFPSQQIDTLEENTEIQE